MKRVYAREFLRGVSRLLSVNVDPAQIVVNRYKYRRVDAFANQGSRPVAPLKITAENTV